VRGAQPCELCLLANRLSTHCRTRVLPGTCVDFASGHTTMELAASRGPLEQRTKEPVMRAVQWARQASGMCFVAAILIYAPAVRGQHTITLKNGMVLEGEYSQVTSLGGDPLNNTGGATSKRIMMVDNQLTRTFFFWTQIASEAPSPAINLERIKV